MAVLESEGPTSCTRHIQHRQGSANSPHFTPTVPLPWPARPLPQVTGWFIPQAIKSLVLLLKLWARDQLIPAVVVWLSSVRNMETIHRRKTNSLFCIDHWTPITWWQLLVTTNLGLIQTRDLEVKTYISYYWRWAQTKTPASLPWKKWGNSAPDWDVETRSISTLSPNLSLPVYLTLVMWPEGMF